MTSTPHTPSDSTQSWNACCFSASPSMSMSGMHSHMTRAQNATNATIAATSRNVFFFLGIVARSRCFMGRLNRLSRRVPYLPSTSLRLASKAAMFASSVLGGTSPSIADFQEESERGR